jgi:hypothetical protein
MPELKKIQLENRDGLPIVPLTMAWSVLFRKSEDISVPRSDTHDFAISPVQVEGEPVNMVSTEGWSHSKFMPVKPGNYYMVSTSTHDEDSSDVCASFYKLFTDAEHNAILSSMNGIPYTDTSNNSLLQAPENASYLVINTGRKDGSTVVAFADIAVLHVETLQRRVEKTDVANMNNELQKDLGVLYRLETVGLEDVMNAGSAYTPQIESLYENADILDSKEFPFDLRYTIEPDFNNGAFKNYITVDVKEYGNKSPKLSLMYIDKTYGGVTERIYKSYSTSSSVELETPIQYGKETFTFHAEKLMSIKEDTETATKYLCFIGANPAQTATESITTGLTKYLVDRIDMNIEVSTTNGDYIWFILPEELYIKSVRSSGFEVPLHGAPSRLNVFGFGAYNAYRTNKPLGDAVWKLSVKQA